MEVSPYRPDQLVGPTIPGDTMRDLNASLTVIKGYAQLVRRRMQRLTIADPVPLLAHLDVIERTVSHVCAQIENRRKP